MRYGMQLYVVVGFWEFLVMAIPLLLLGGVDNRFVACLLAVEFKKLISFIANPFLSDFFLADTK